MLQFYPQPKPEPRKRIKARRLRQRVKATHEVRAWVFARERNLCRCCRKRPATSMHELRFRSLGGKVSRQNSVAVCGDGVNGCHGLLQRNEIRFIDWGHGAEGPLLFKPTTPAACDWMQLAAGRDLVSEPMRLVEED